MKVAFATRDGVHVQGELRRTPLVVLYDVTADGFRLDRASSFANGSARSEQRIEAIAGAEIAYVGAIGPSTAARLARRGIRPAPAHEGAPIDEILAAIVQQLAARSREVAIAPA